MTNEQEKTIMELSDEEFERFLDWLIQRTDEIISITNKIEQIIEEQNND